MRDNGAIEGAAAGFAEEDSVIVQVKHDRSVARVVAHVDGVRACGFVFTLTRADGALATDALGVWIDACNSSGQSVDTSANHLGNGKWAVTFVDPADGKDQDGYWFSYGCTHGIGTQYPHRFKSADKLQPGDLIKPGEYADTIPFFKVTGEGLGEFDDFSSPVQATLNVECSEPFRAYFSVSGSVGYDFSGPLGVLAFDGEGCEISVRTNDGGINDTWISTGYHLTSGAGAVHGAGNAQVALTLEYSGVMTKVFGDPPETYTYHSVNVYNGYIYGSATHEI